MVTIATVDAARESEICNYEDLQKTIWAARSAVILSHAKLKQYFGDAEKDPTLDVTMIIEENMALAAELALLYEA